MEVSLCGADKEFKKENLPLRKQNSGTTESIIIKWHLKRNEAKRKSPK